MSGEDHWLKQSGAKAWALGGLPVGTFLGSIAAVFLGLDPGMGGAIGLSVGAAIAVAFFLAAPYVERHEQKQIAEVEARTEAQAEARQEALAAEQSAAEQESLARWIPGPDGLVLYHPGEANPASIRTPGGRGPQTPKPAKPTEEKVWFQAAEKRTGRLSRCTICSTEVTVPPSSRSAPCPGCGGMVFEPRR